MNIHTSAHRQLNPFAGVLQIAETDEARAFSANGVLWRIQTLANRPDHTWRSNGKTPTTRQYFNWGLWSPDEGVRHVIANPILDIGAMENAAKALIAALETQLEALPFALADHYELWACDPAGRPVALLDSASNPENRHDGHTNNWQSVAKNEHGFTSNTLKKAGHRPNQHAAFLEDRVRAHTNQLCWFKREPDGTGTPLRQEEPMHKTPLPELGFSEEWDDPLVQGAFDDYARWCAPLLLTLPLSTNRRRRLEQQAKERSTLVDDLYRLYPAVIDPQLMEQARVQARLLRSQ